MSGLAAEPGIARRYTDSQALQLYAHHGESLLAWFF